MKSYKNILIDVARERQQNNGQIGTSDIVILPKSAEDSRKEPEMKFFRRDFADSFNTVDELLSVLGKKWKITLEKIGRFCNFYYLRADRQEVGLDPELAPVFPISCTNHQLVEEFGGEMTVNRIIRKCEEIGVLVRITDKYRFGCGDPSLNRCYVYAFNQKLAELVFEACNVKGISCISRIRKREMERVDAVEQPAAPEPAAKTVLDDDARITLRTYRIGVKDYDDETVKALIERKYAGLVEPRKEKIDWINERVPLDERIRFETNVDRDRRGIVNRVGWRATSRIVSYKAHENGSAEYKGMWRKDYLNSRFGVGKWHEYDVRGSIYQIAHLLNFGEWLGNGSDPYELMYGGKFASKGDRNAFKSICMPFYFDNPKCLLSHNRQRIPKCIRRYGKDVLQQTFDRAIEAMEDFTGERFHNEVFLHESLLYIDFVFRLMEQEDVRKVVQVYDGFTFGADDWKLLGGSLDRILAECAQVYCKDYRRWRDADSGRPKAVGSRDLAAESREG